MRSADPAIEMFQNVVTRGEQVLDVLREQGVIPRPASMDRDELALLFLEKGGGMDIVQKFDIASPTMLAKAAYDIMIARPSWDEIRPKGAGYKRVVDCAARIIAETINKKENT